MLGCYQTEESTVEHLKVDLDSKEVFKLEESLLSSTPRLLVDSARKSIDKLFVSQNQAYKMSWVEGGKQLYFSYSTNSSQLALTDFYFGKQLSVRFGTLAIGQLRQLSKDSPGTFGHLWQELGQIDNAIKISGLKYFVLRFPTRLTPSNHSDSIKVGFELFALEGSILGGWDYLLIQQIFQKNLHQGQDMKPTLLKVNYFNLFM